MIIKNLLAHKFFWLTIAVTWTSIVFYLCLIDSSELPSLKIKIDGFDKVVHFSFHFIFTVFWLIYLNIANKITTKIQIVRVVVASFLVGTLIEILQGCFTTSRNADIADVLANSFGTIVSGIIMYFIFRRINN